MKDHHTFIVAEIGVNHNGSLDLAKQLVDAAVTAGADAVKFQTFKPENLVSFNAPKAKYQKQTTDRDESQYEMLQKLQLSDNAHRIIKTYCIHKKIQFLSTPFDLESVDLLVNDLDLSMIKIASPDITNAPLLLKIARTKRQVILSTGMSTLGEIEQALSILAFGFIKPEDFAPSQSEFRLAYTSEIGQGALGKKVSLLHATSEYPADIRDTNLRVLDTLQVAFHLPVGLSDHTKGIVVPIAAVARGAKIIEKHLTLDKSMIGPDHVASLEPAEFQNMVDSIRQVESALGSPLKLPTPIEQKNAEVVRRSIVANCPIAKGEVFSEKNLGVKRPGGGLSPMYYFEQIGKIATRSYKKDEMIR